MKSSRSHRTLSEAGYRLTGHLGNTTVLFRDADEDGQIAAEGSGPGAGEVMQRLWYYPFGLQLQGIGLDESAPAHLCRYNGKAWDPASGLSDYGARWYDAGSGRWSGVDPLAGEFPSWSPYHYVYDNPVIHTDPTGMAADWIPEYNESTGTISYISEDGDSYDTFVKQYGESAAEEIFNSNCDGCFDKSETYSEGQISLNSDTPLKLVIDEKVTKNQGMDYMKGGNGKEVTTDIQDIHNQIELASEVSGKQGDGTFSVNEYFSRRDGNAIGSFSVEGSITVDKKFTFNRSAIEYSSSLATQRISSSPVENSIRGGFKREFRIGYKTPLLVTYRTKQ